MVARAASPSPSPIPTPRSLSPLLSLEKRRALFLVTWSLTSPLSNVVLFTPCVLDPELRPLIAADARVATVEDEEEGGTASPAVKCMKGPSAPSAS